MKQKKYLFLITNRGDTMQIIEYDEKYLEDVKDLLVELEEYILTIDKDNLDQLHPEYRDKMAILDLKEISVNEGKCYLALENNKVIGLIMGYIRNYDEYDYLDYKCPRSGEISELIVSKNTRSKGIGKCLMQKMEEYLKSIGCEYIFIDVFAYNENAIKFYEKLGFHTRGLIDIKKLNNDNNFKCVIATKDLIIQKWNEEIKKHNDSDVWKEFKKESLRNVDNRIVYMGLLNDKIIAEATAIISEKDLDMQNKEDLVGSGKVCLSAFRTNKEYQNKGYFSKLYKFMEKDLKEKNRGIEKPEIILVDALTKIDTDHIPYQSIIKGDAKSYSIAAASIIAKVTRDRIMRQWDEVYPEYGFAGHKGYGAAKHIEAIKKYGPCPIHRRTFIKNFME